eukprot:m.605736 g.605736  ORF g.605736 m.605736 type:complete len:472 (-) comp22468_c0_seq5:68-1483(-)
MTSEADEHIYRSTPVCSVMSQVDRLIESKRFTWENQLRDALRESDQWRTNFSQAQRKYESIVQENVKLRGRLKLVADKSKELSRKYEMRIMRQDEQLRAMRDMQQVQAIKQHQKQISRLRQSSLSAMDKNQVAFHEATRLAALGGSTSRRIHTGSTSLSNASSKDQKELNELKQMIVDLETANEADCIRAASVQQRLEHENRTLNKQILEQHALISDLKSKGSAVPASSKSLYASDVKYTQTDPIREQTVASGDVSTTTAQVPITAHVTIPALQNRICELEASLRCEEARFTCLRSECSNWQREVKSLQTAFHSATSQLRQLQREQQTQTYGKAIPQLPDQVKNPSPLHTQEPQHASMEFQETANKVLVDGCSDSVNAHNAVNSAAKGSGKNNSVALPDPRTATATVQPAIIVPEAAVPRIPMTEFIADFVAREHDRESSLRSAIELHLHQPLMAATHPATRTPDALPSHA